MPPNTLRWPPAWGRLPEQLRRAIWLSDVHLGWRASEAGRLLDFLRHYEADIWCLVGDMIDGWALKRSWYWPQTHNDVVQKMLRKVRKGATVVCIPGNHDEFLREFAGLEFGGIRIQTEVYHRTGAGQTLWVAHGEAFDSVIHFAPWLTSLGNNGYDALILIGRHINRLRRWCGARDWSFSTFVKGRVKDIVRFVSDYESALVREAQRRGVDGVVCGHIHKAEMCRVRGVDYYNTGDWVESCTALVEHRDGRMEIVRWPRRPVAEGGAG